MSYNEVLTEIIGKAQARDVHRVIEVIGTYEHYSDWVSDKKRADVDVELVTDQVIVEGCAENTKSWEAYDEVLPNGRKMRTIFVKTP